MYKKPKLPRGYKEVRNKVKATARYTRDCNNCNFFYKTPEDEEEMCQNSNVLEYDICSDMGGKRVYCVFWEGIKDEER